VGAETEVERLDVEVGTGNFKELFRSIEEYERH
jgi:hypothetical protein